MARPHRFRSRHSLGRMPIRVFAVCFRGQSFRGRQPGDPGGHPLKTNDFVASAPAWHKRYQALNARFGESERGVGRVVGVFWFIEGCEPPRNRPS